MGEVGENAGWGIYEGGGLSLSYFKNCVDNQEKQRTCILPSNIRKSHKYNIGEEIRSDSVSCSMSISHLQSSKINVSHCNSTQNRNHVGISTTVASAARSSISLDSTAE